MRYVFFLYILGVPFVLQSMEQKVTQSTVTKPLNIINHITSPLYCAFLNNHQAVVAGKNGCSIIDIIKNKEITKITDLVFSYNNSLKLKVHPNKETILFFDTQAQTTTVHNLKIQHKWSQIWYDIHIKDVLFNPLKNGTTFLFYSVKNKPGDYLCENNYYTNIQQCINLKKSFPFYNTIHHPTQSCIINICDGCISYIENFFITQEQNTGMEIPHCHFNQNGSKTIFQYHTKAHINAGTIDKQYLSKTIFYSHPAPLHRRIIGPITTVTIDNKERIANCIFHPNENVVMTLSFNNTISYWDAINAHLIYKQTIEDNSCPSHDIACSPYGKHLLIMREKECLLIPVPQEIIWYKRMPYLFFLLKQCVSQLDFPAELMKLIMQNMQHGL